jgi:hypothetical protein
LWRTSGSAPVPPSSVNSKTTWVRREVNPMTVTFNMSLLQPIVALIAGILILFIPRILNFVVAIYLILVGVMGLWPHLLSIFSH